MLSPMHASPVLGNRSQLKLAGQPNPKSFIGSSQLFLTLLQRERQGRIGLSRTQFGAYTEQKKRTKSREQPTRARGEY